MAVSLLFYYFGFILMPKFAYRLNGIVIGKR